MARSNKKRGPSPRVIRLHEQEEQQTTAERKTKVELIPRNLSQEAYITNLYNPNKRIVFAIGPAGTGKTYLAVQKAMKDFKEGRINKIVVTRPAVSNGEQHGYLPGDLNQKMAPWTRPVFDVIEEYFNPRDVKNMLEEGIIEIAPLAFMRGRTFKHSIVILDESQNTTPAQMKMALTRIGEGSRMFVTGDLRQSDYKEGKNGLYDFCTKLDADYSSMISVTKFSRDDIERDEIVTEVLRLYGEDD
jgi:phosphate starvation-inducible PhoH-like protein